VTGKCEGGKKNEALVIKGGEGKARQWGSARKRNQKTKEKGEPCPRSGKNKGWGNRKEGQTGIGTSSKPKRTEGSAKKQ